MELSINNFNAGHMQLFMNAYGDSPAVILNNHGIIPVNCNADGRCKPVCRFINGIINDFPKHMVQTPASGAADIHARTDTNRLQAFHYLYIINGIIVLILP